MSAPITRPERSYRRAIDRRRYRLKAEGRWQDPLVDARPAFEHVQALRAAGTGWRSIAIAAGVPIQRVNSLVYMRPERILRETAEALLAVRADPAVLPDHARLDPTGTTRRLRALAVAGISIVRIAEVSGISEYTLQALTRGENQHVSARTARTVDELFRRWAFRQHPAEAARMTKQGATRARARALRAGWVPAAAWDDDTIDDPAAKPHGVLVEAA